MAVHEHLQGVLDSPSEARSSHLKTVLKYSDRCECGYEFLV